MHAGVSRRDSSVIVAFIFSILALILVSSVVVFVVVIKKCYSKNTASVKPTGKLCTLNCIKRKFAVT